MATLEKIRSKSVFLIVVIAVALLAFIIGDALTNSRNIFGDHTTVAKIGDQKIDYTEYQAKREELNSQLEIQKRQNPDFDFDTQLLPQIAINQLIAEKLLDNAADKLGISTSGDQLRYYMIENPVNQNLGTLLQQMQQAGLSVQLPQQAYEIIFNPKRNGLTDADVAGFRKMWIALEKETSQMIRRNTYQRLLAGTVKANDLDRKALYNDYVALANVEVAFKPYGTLDAKKYPVSDAELQAEYNKNKNQFRVDEETKRVSFIAVNILPSAADRKASRALCNSVLAQLRDSNATLGKDAKKQGVSMSRQELLASAIKNDSVKNFVATAAPGAIRVVSNNTKGFQIVKMGSRVEQLDSLQLNIVTATSAALANKVMARLNSGLAVDSISKVFSPDSVMVQSKQWITLFNEDGPTNALQTSQLDSLRQAGGKFIKLLEQNGAVMLAQISEQKAPKTVYEFEQYDYDLKPSTTTTNAARAKFEKFLAANNTASKFNANAAKAGYMVQNFDLTQSSPAVPLATGAQQYYPESRQVVRWVMIEGKDGEVSHIYNSSDPQDPRLYAVAIDSSYEDFIPYTHPDVKAGLTEKVRRDKAGEAWVKQYKGKGKSVAAVAKAMNVTPNNVEKFRMTANPYVRDAGVIGRIMGAKKGVLKVVKGLDGVYVFTVKGNAKDGFKYDKQAFDQQYLQFINPDMGEMLRGARKFKNNAYKFEAGD